MMQALMEAIDQDNLLSIVIMAAHGRKLEKDAHWETVFIWWL
jgi:hypothetical protein